MQYMRAHNARSGFTLVEVLVVAPVMLLTIGVFVGLILSITGEVLVARSSNQVAHDTQAALTMIEDDVRTSGSFLHTNNIPVQSPQGYNNTSTAFNITLSSQTPRPLIINAIATTGGAYQANRSPVWLRDSPNPCTNSELRAQNQVMTYNIVYFVRDNTLWRRVIMPSTYATAGCPGQTPDQRPTCASGTMGSSLCVAEDTRVLNDVQDFSVTYHTTADNTTTPLSLANAGNGTTAHVTITAHKTVAGNDIIYTNSVRAIRAGTRNTDATP